MSYGKQPINPEDSDDDSSSGDECSCSEDDASESEASSVDSREVNKFHKGQPQQPRGRPQVPLPQNIHTKHPVPQSTIPPSDDDDDEDDDDDGEECQCNTEPSEPATTYYRATIQPRVQANPQYSRLIKQPEQNLIEVAYSYEKSDPVSEPKKIVFQEATIRSLPEDSPQYGRHTSAPLGVVIQTDYIEDLVFQRASILQFPESRPDYATTLNLPQDAKGILIEKAFVEETIFQTASIKAIPQTSPQYINVTRAPEGLFIEKDYIEPVLFETATVKAFRQEEPKYSSTTRAIEGILIETYYLEIPVFQRALINDISRNNPERANTIPKFVGILVERDYIEEPIIQKVVKDNQVYGEPIKKIESKKDCSCHPTDCAESLADKPKTKTKKPIIEKAPCSCDPVDCAVSLGDAKNKKLKKGNKAENLKEIPEVSTSRSKDPPEKPERSTKTKETDFIKTASTYAYEKPKKDTKIESSQSHKGTKTKPDKLRRSPCSCDPIECSVSLGESKKAEKPEQSARLKEPGFSKIASTYTYEKPKADSEHESSPSYKLDKTKQEKFREKPACSCDPVDCRVSTSGKKTKVPKTKPEIQKLTTELLTRLTLKDKPEKQTKIKPTGLTKAKSFALGSSQEEPDCRCQVVDCTAGTADYKKDKKPKSELGAQRLAMQPLTKTKVPQDKADRSFKLKDKCVTKAKSFTLGSSKKEPDCSCKVVACTASTADYKKDKKSSSELEAQRLALEPLTKSKVTPDKAEKSNKLNDKGVTKAKSFTLGSSKKEPDCSCKVVACTASTADYKTDMKHKTELGAQRLAMEPLTKTKVPQDKAEKSFTLKDKGVTKAKSCTLESSKKEPDCSCKVVACTASTADYKKDKKSNSELEAKRLALQPLTKSTVTPDKAEKSIKLKDEGATKAKSCTLGSTKKEPDCSCKVVACTASTADYKKDKKSNSELESQRLALQPLTKSKVTPDKAEKSITIKDRVITKAKSFTAGSSKKEPDCSCKVVACTASSAQRLPLEPLTKKKAPKDKTEKSVIMKEKCVTKAKSFTVGTTGKQLDCTCKVVECSASTTKKYEKKAVSEPEIQKKVIIPVTTTKVVEDKPKPSIKLKDEIVASDPAYDFGYKKPIKEPIAQTSTFVPLAKKPKIESKSKTLAIEKLIRKKLTKVKQAQSTKLKRKSSQKLLALEPLSRKKLSKEKPEHSSTLKRSISHIPLSTTMSAQDKPDKTSKIKETPESELLALEQLSRRKISKEKLERSSNLKRSISHILLSKTMSAQEKPNRSSKIKKTECVACESTHKYETPEREQLALEQLSRKKMSKEKSEHSSTLKRSISHILLSKTMSGQEKPDRSSKIKKTEYVACDSTYKYETPEREQLALEQLSRKKTSKEKPEHSSTLKRSISHILLSKTMSGQEKPDRSSKIKKTEYVACDSTYKYETPEREQLALEQLSRKKMFKEKPEHSSTLKRSISHILLSKTMSGQEKPDRSSKIKKTEYVACDSTYKYETPEREQLALEQLSRKKMLKEKPEHSSTLKRSISHILLSKTMSAQEKPDRSSKIKKTEYVACDSTYKYETPEREQLAVEQLSRKKMSKEKPEHSSTLKRSISHILLSKTMAAEEKPDRSSKIKKTEYVACDSTYKYETPEREQLALEQLSRKKMSKEKPEHSSTLKRSISHILLSKTMATEEKPDRSSKIKKTEYVACDSTYKYETPEREQLALEALSRNKMSKEKPEHSSTLKRSRSHLLLSITMAAQKNPDRSSKIKKTEYVACDSTYKYETPEREQLAIEALSRKKIAREQPERSITLKRSNSLNLLSKTIAAQEKPDRSSKLKRKECVPCSSAYTYERPQSAPETFTLAPLSKKKTQEKPDRSSKIKQKECIPCESTYKYQESEQQKLTLESLSKTKKEPEKAEHSSKLTGQTCSKAKSFSLPSRAEETGCNCKVKDCPHKKDKVIKDKVTKDKVTKDKVKKDKDKKDPTMKEPLLKTRLPHDKPERSTKVTDKPLGKAISIATPLTANKQECSCVATDCPHKKDKDKNDTTINLTLEPLSKTRIQHKPERSTKVKGKSLAKAISMTTRNKQECICVVTECPPTTSDSKKKQLPLEPLTKKKLSEDKPNRSFKTQGKELSKAKSMTMPVAKTKQECVCKVTDCPPTTTDSKKRLPLEPLTKKNLSEDKPERSSKTKGNEFVPTTSSYKYEKSKSEPDAQKYTTEPLKKTKIPHEKPDQSSKTKGKDYTQGTISDKYEKSKSEPTAEKLALESLKKAKTQQEKPEQSSKTKGKDYTQGTFSDKYAKSKSEPAAEKLALESLKKAKIQQEKPEQSSKTKGKDYIQGTISDKSEKSKSEPAAEKLALESLKKAKIQQEKPEQSSKTKGKDYIQGTISDKSEKSKSEPAAEKLALESLKKAKIQQEKAEQSSKIKGKEYIPSTLTDKYEKPRSEPDSQKLALEALKKTKMPRDKSDRSSKIKGKECNTSTSTYNYNKSKSETEVEKLNLEPLIRKKLSKDNREYSSKLKRKSSYEIITKTNISNEKPEHSSKLKDKSIQALPLEKLSRSKIATEKPERSIPLRDKSTITAEQKHIKPSTMYREHVTMTDTFYKDERPKYKTELTRPTESPRICRCNEFKEKPRTEAKPTQQFQPSPQKPWNKPKPKRKAPTMYQKLTKTKILREQTKYIFKLKGKSSTELSCPDICKDKDKPETDTQPVFQQINKTKTLRESTKYVFRLQGKHPPNIDPMEAFKKAEGDIDTDGPIFPNMGKTKSYCDKKCAPGTSKPKEGPVTNPVCLAPNNSCPATWGKNNPITTTCPYCGNVTDVRVVGPNRQDTLILALMLAPLLLCCIPYMVKKPTYQCAVCNATLKKT